MIRVALVAPAPAWRAGLRALLVQPAAPLEAGARLEIVGEAADLAGLARTAPEADVLVIAAEQPPGPEDWLALEAWLDHHAQAGASPEPARPGIVLLSSDPTPARRLAELPLRAWGLLPLDAAADELQAAVAAVCQGLVVGASAWMSGLARSAAETEMLIALPQGGRVQAAGDTLDTQRLTGRELQVLELLARGLANKQIAASLGISEHTAKFHISAIYQKLGAANRAEAVRNGLQRGLISI